LNGGIQNPGGMFAVLLTDRPHQKTNKIKTPLKKPRDNVSSYIYGLSSVYVSYG